MSWFSLVTKYGATALPDHDISVLTVTATSTGWRHTRVCTECRAPVGHEEFMTQICLTCGSAMRSLPRSAAMRRIVFGGRWVETLRIGNTEYVNRGGEWVPVTKAKGGAA